MTVAVRKNDVLIFSLSRWDAPISSPSFSLAKEFAKTNRVFYIDHPFSIKDVAKGWMHPSVTSRRRALFTGTSIYRNPPGLPRDLTVVTPRVTLPINFLPGGEVYRKLSRLNDRVLFNTIRRILADYSVENFVYLNAFDHYFGRDFPPDIHPVVKVYQSMDDLSQVPYTARHGIRLEEEIIRKFDITLTTSRELTRLKSPYSDHVYFHPNAVDLCIFDQALTKGFERPDELAGIDGRKVIGYVGNIESRIDYELLRKVIDYHRDKILLMVGPVTTDEHKNIGLAGLPNVIMTGPKKLEELPRYLQYMDCTIIPFKKNILTRSIYPLKVNEYLAAGRPVVSSDFSEDIVGFAPEVLIAKDADEFVTSIDRAISTNDANKIKARRKVAQSNTWTSRVEAFWRIVENYLNRGGQLRKAG